MRKSITLRRLKIKEGIRYRKFRGHTLYPILHIQGVWLQEAGFKPRTSVYLIIKDGQIIIKPETKERA